MDWEESRNAARRFIEQANTEDPSALLKSAKKLAKKLRHDREFDLLDYFAEELRQRGVDDPELIKNVVRAFLIRNPFVLSTASKAIVRVPHMGSVDAARGCQDETAQRGVGGEVQSQ
jgi:hypothetical protein